MRTRVRSFPAADARQKFIVKARRGGFEGVAGAGGAGDLESGMFITGLGVAAPETRYRQKDCWEALRGSAQFVAGCSGRGQFCGKCCWGTTGLKRVVWR